MGMPTKEANKIPHKNSKTVSKKRNLNRIQQVRALPLQGKKRKLTKELWLDYFCKERLKLTPGQIGKVMKDLQKAMPAFKRLIGQSFLSEDRQVGYRTILQARAKRLGLTEE
jgi:serine/threonine-protein kinase HipA